MVKTIIVNMPCSVSPTEIFKLALPIDLVGFKKHPKYAEAEEFQAMALCCFDHRVRGKGVVDLVRMSYSPPTFCS